jgi:hypothetical protein
MGGALHVGRGALANGMAMPLNHPVLWVDLISKLGHNHANSLKKALGPCSPRNILRPWGRYWVDDLTGWENMTADIITIEDRDNELHALLERVMLLVPEKDKQDLNLQRIIAFRLKLDGEAETRAYLVKKIEETIQCAYTGSLYEFLKDDNLEKECAAKNERPDPPDVA